MRKRRLGQSDLELTVVGLGTWAIGGPWQFGWGQQDDQASIETIIVAIEGGINWIDTAPIYGCGHSEDVVGRAIKEMGEKPLIATKCGLLWNDKKEKINCLEGASIIAECEASLRRLGVEVIDLYQMHWPFPIRMIEEGWEAMAKLVQQGKVRYIGVSNFNIGQIKRVSVIHEVTSLQPPYSMLERRYEKQLTYLCADQNIGVICYSPMQAGMLTGKFSAQRVAELAADDWRRQSPHFFEPRLSANLALIERLRPIAERNGKTLAQLAISWVLRRKEVTAAIVGARKPQQIQETIKAGDWVLSEDDIAQVDVLLEEYQEQVNNN